MLNWTEADLTDQFRDAAATGWLPYFETAAHQTGLPIELLLGVASRETNIRNIKGDLRNGIYHGYGVMQVDIGTQPDFCRTWTAGEAQGSIHCGAQVLAGKRNYLAHRGITDLKAVAAAYNTGEGNVFRSIRAGADPDRTTSGGDYGFDVLARTEIFANLAVIFLNRPKI